MRAKSKSCHVCKIELAMYVKVKMPWQIKKVNLPWQIKQVNLPWSDKKRCPRFKKRKFAMDERNTFLMVKTNKNCHGQKQIALPWQRTKSDMVQTKNKVPWYEV